MILEKDEFLEKVKSSGVGTRLYEDLDAGRFELIVPVHNGEPQFFYSPCVFALSSAEMRDYVNEVWDAVRDHAPSRWY